MSEKKKIKVLTIIVIALGIALCFAFVKINDLELRIRNLQGYMNSSVSMLENSINSIYNIYQGSN